MNNNAWFKKEKPLLGVVGTGGGVAQGSSAAGTPSDAASGGTLVEGSGWRMHVFKTPGTLVAAEDVDMYVTCVGGGGGGGCNSYSDNRAAGGGGGGGFNSPTSIKSLVNGTTYPVQIGAGGPGPVMSPPSSVTNNPYAPGPPSEPMNINGGGGGTSRFGFGTPHVLYAGGGGGGGAHNAYPGPNPGGGPANNYTSGSPAPSILNAPSYTSVPNLQCPTTQFGSGGGGAHNGTGTGGPLGNDGGAWHPYPEGTGGGGGGAGSVGGAAPTGLIAGNGGAGAALAVIPTPVADSLLSPISVGASGLFAGGGGGKGTDPGGGAGGPGGGGAGGIAPTGGVAAGTPGGANTGGGGGGNNKVTGGAGGSGVVIAYYPI